MACGCKKNSATVQKVKQVVKKIPTQKTTNSETPKRKIYKKITYRRPI